MPNTVEPHWFRAGSRSEDYGYARAPLCRVCGATLSDPLHNANPAPDRSFDVTVSSHDELQKGITAARRHGSQHAHHRVVVSGDYGHTEASLLAAQMAAATSGMPTGVYPRE